MRYNRKSIGFHDSKRMTHQPRTMFDPQVGTLEFFWDANGERVYKLTGISNLGQVNSGSTQAQAILMMQYSIPIHTWWLRLKGTPFNIYYYGQGKVK